MSFWKQLASARALGQPTVFSNPLAAPATTAEEVFGWMCQGAADKTLKLRVYRPGAMEIVRDWHQPTPADGSMGGFMRRLDSHLGSSGIVVNDLQASCPAAWRRLQPILGELFAEVPMPAGGASFEVFSGAYKRGLFGVHKDDQDVITFVLEGRKRFRLWPYPYFAGQAPPDMETRAHAFRDLDFDPESGLVLEGGPGDVFFWPAEWWHLAESDGEQCTTVGIGLFRGVTTNQFVEQAALTVDGELEVPRVAAGGRADAGLRLAQRTLDTVLGHAELRARVEGRMLAFTSGFGCRAFPKPGDQPLPGGTVRASIGGSIAWAESGESVAWAVNGTHFRYPSRRPILQLLEHVADGKPFVPSQLASQLADEEVGADALEHILGLLHRHHALDEMS